MLKFDQGCSLVVPNFWNDHVLGWWKHKDDRNILFLKYEDLHTVMLRYLDLAAVHGVFSTDLRPMSVPAKIYIYICLNTVKIGH